MKVIPTGSNQTEVTLRLNNGELATILFSYRTPVAALIGNKWYRTEKRWSVTTSRHINKFLGDSEAVTMPQSFFDHLEEHPK